MIDKKELLRLKPRFELLSRLIDFPTEETFHQSADNWPELEALLAELQEKDLQTLQEDYTRLFELNKRLTLYMTYYRFQDSRERGTMLAKLKMLYEMFGVSLEKAELTDYLPAMLEFLAAGDFGTDTRLNDLQLLFDVLEDGSYEILAHAKEEVENPYIHLIALVRKTLRRCVLIGEPVKERIG